MARGLPLETLYNAPNGGFAVAAPRQNPSDPFKIGILGLLPRLGLMPICPEFLLFVIQLRRDGTR